MAIEPVDHRILAIAQEAAEEAFRITIDALVIDPDTGAIFIQGSGLGDVEKIQPEDTQMSQPWGTRSLPPDYVEGVLTPGNPYATMASTRDPRPPDDLFKGSKKQARGENALYDEDGNMVRLRKALGGVLGKSGSALAELAIARITDRVAVNAFLEQYTDDLKDDIVAIKADLVTLFLFHSGAPTLIPLTTSRLDEGDKIADICEGSTLWKSQ